MGYRDIHGQSTVSNTVNGAIVVNFAVAVGGVREDKSQMFLCEFKGLLKGL